MFTEGLGMIAPEALLGDSDQDGGQGCQWGTVSAEAGVPGGRDSRGQGGPQGPRDTQRQEQA